MSKDTQNLGLIGVLLLLIMALLVLFRKKAQTDVKLRITEPGPLQGRIIVQELPLLAPGQSCQDNADICHNICGGVWDPSKIGAPYGPCIAIGTNL